MADIGKILLGFGVLLVVLGVMLLVIGRLPGDIVVQRGNWTFYFPLATSLLLSVLLTILLSFFSRR